jgi:hypothetical protein
MSCNASPITRVERIRLTLNFDAEIVTQITWQAHGVIENAKMLADNFVIIVECMIICTRIVFAVRVICYSRIAQLKNFADRLSGPSCPKARGFTCCKLQMILVTHPEY